MKLEVGMYVRSKINGMIGKITDIEETKVFDSYLTVIREETRYILDGNSNKGFCKTENDSVKTSYNIADLIEEHDYIRIITSNYFEPVYYSYGKLVIRDDIDISKYTNKFITEVITHEQIKKMSYKVDE